MGVERPAKTLGEGQRLLESVARKRRRRAAGPARRACRRTSCTAALKVRAEPGRHHHGWGVVLGTGRRRPASSRTIHSRGGRLRHAPRIRRPDPSGRRRSQVPASGGAGSGLAFWIGAHHASSYHGLPERRDDLRRPRTAPPGVELDAAPPRRGRSASRTPAAPPSCGARGCARPSSTPPSRGRPGSAGPPPPAAAAVRTGSASGRSSAVGRRLARVRAQLRHQVVVLHLLGLLSSRGGGLGTWASAWGFGAGGLGGQDHGRLLRRLGLGLRAPGRRASRRGPAAPWSGRW